MRNVEQTSYCYRAVDKKGDTIDIYLSETRDQLAAAKFLKNALTSEHSNFPKVINVGKARSYPAAVNMSKQAGYLLECMVLRQVKYLNNRIEADHFPIKELIMGGLGFGSLEGAIRTISGDESMRMNKKGQSAATRRSAAD